MCLCVIEQPTKLLKYTCNRDKSENNMNIKKDTVALDILNIYVDYNASCSTGYFSSHHSFSFRTYQGKYRKDKWHQEKISSNNTNFLAMTETLVHKIHPYLK